MKLMKRFFGAAGVALIVLLFTSLGASAQVVSEPRNSARPDRIVGLWDVQVSVASCAGGPVFNTFPAMHKYEFGGTGQVVPAGNPTGLSAHMMVWTHLDGNNYLSRFKMYRYDASGQTVGWTILTNEVSINEEATEYTGSGYAEFFDNNGNLLMASCPSFTGTRFSTEP